MRILSGGRQTPASARLWWGYRRGDKFLYSGRFYGNGRLTAAQDLGHTVRGPFVATNASDARQILTRKLAEFDTKVAHEKLLASKPQKLLTRHTEELESA